MKKYISIILACIILTALSFTGCGKDDKVNSENTSKSSSINNIKPIVVEEYFDGKLKLIKSNDNSQLFGV